MFRIVNDGLEFEFPDMALVAEAVSTLGDTTIIVSDQRPGGRDHYLVIEATGAVHELYGSRLIVRDVGMLLQTPGRPVYAAGTTVDA